MRSLMFSYSVGGVVSSEFTRDNKASSETDLGALVGTGPSSSPETGVASDMSSPVVSRTVVRW
jgi:hypothetical protein